jgi:hypothetical protein
MLILSYLYSVSNNLRLTLDKCSQRWNCTIFHDNSFSEKKSGLHPWTIAKVRFSALNYKNG